MLSSVVPISGLIRRGTVLCILLSLPGTDNELTRCWPLLDGGLTGEGACDAGLLSTA
jgi:hypothetical protein